VAEGGRDQRDRVRDGEGGDDRDQRPEAAERHDQAEQEKEMVGAAEDVDEAGVDEAERRLVPARIEQHAPRVAVEIERPGLAGREQEPEHHVDLDAEALEMRTDGELRAIGADGVFEQHVEQPWLQ
jgi:hypothetical protein